MLDVVDVGKQQVAIGLISIGALRLLVNWARSRHEQAKINAFLGNYPEPFKGAVHSHHHKGVCCTHYVNI